MDKIKILDEIKKLLKFNKDEKFIDVKTGEYILRVEGDELEIGKTVYVVSEEGVNPFPAELSGDHILENGYVITVDELGIITDIKAPEIVETPEIETQETFEVVETEVVETEKVEEKETTDFNEKFISLENRINEMELMIKEMINENKETKDFSKIVLDKIESFGKDVPAEKVELDFKDDYKVEKTKDNLDSIRILRNKNKK